MIQDPTLQQLIDSANARSQRTLAQIRSPGGGSVRRVFEHWVYMLMRHPERTALGPRRVAVIEAALEMYPEATLLLAIEGCAASAWHAGANDRRKAFQDLELILRDEVHIERFADEGARLRERAERMADQEAAQVVERAQATPEVVQQQSAAAEQAREKLRRLAMTLRSRGS